MIDEFIGVAQHTKRNHMGHRFHLIVISVFIGLVVWFSLGSKTAWARQTSESISPPAAVKSPPLPAFAPQLGPPLTYGFHRHNELPPTTGKWIDVDLSEQRVVAYEGRKPVRAFIVSTGLPDTPTVQGAFRIRMKVRAQTMFGPGYYLPNGEWVQYYYEDYGFHGTYRHNNFGHPMSHGCINMTNDDAQWLFAWAGPAWDPQGDVWQKVSPADLGTLVVVHE